MKRRKDDIRLALEKNLSGLNMTAAQRAAIREKIRGGKTVKRKIPAVLVLALVLMLVSVTALAVSNWETIKTYLETVRFLTYESTGLWPMEDQVKLVEAMHGAGMDMDETVYQALQKSGLSDSEREVLCAQLIEARYGENWQYKSIEEMEWPLAQRLESEEAMREYDQWNDQVQERWEESHPTPEIPDAPLTEEEIRKAFRTCLGEYGLSDQTETPLALAYHPEEELWLGQGRTEEGKNLYFTCTAYGQERRLRFLEMDEQMVENMCDSLTEIHGFVPGSYDRERIQVMYHPESAVWEASYAISEENPGLEELTLDEMESGIQPITVLESIRRQKGEAVASYIFRTFYSNLNQYLSGYTLEEALCSRDAERARPAVSEETAWETALQGIAEKYGQNPKELSTLRKHAALYENGDGSREYYMELTAYDYSENLARIWRYAARVDADSGVLLAAVSRADWNPVTGRKLTEDASPEMARMVWDREMMDALRRAAGDESGSGWGLMTNASGEYFYAWTLAEKAAFSQEVKPRVDQFLAENPEYARYLQERYEKEGQDGPPYYNATRHVYGLPDEQALTCQEAIARAQTIAKEQLRAREDDFRGLPDIYYDVTDPERPLWKVHFNTTDRAVYPDDPWGYFVCLDARTGQTETCFIRTVETPMEDLM